VAAIAVLIGYGVADLALNVTQVLLVLGITLGVGPDVLVAVFAFHHGRVLIPGSGRLARTMEFLAVALGTGHGLPGPVNISRDALILPEVLGTDTGAVTGGTAVLHGGSIPEFMPGNKAATHLIRPADMALTAGCVALLAVIFQHRGQRGTLGCVTTPGFKDGFKTAERRMETNLIGMGDVLVTGVAITVRRVDDQTRVGYFLDFGTAVTAVTDDAADLTVGTLKELSILDENLLPYLQRR